MRDLDTAAKLFQASTRLQRASTALERIARGAELDSSDQQALQWAGEFLPHVDLDSPVPSSGVAGGLSVQATAVRPTWYASLLKVLPAFAAEGLHEGELTKFFAALFRLLKDGGRSSPVNSLPPRRLFLAANFLHELSAGLLSSNTSTAASRWKM